MLPGRRSVRSVSSICDCCPHSILVIFAMIVLAIGGCDGDKESSSTGPQANEPTIESISPIFGPPSTTVRILGENFSNIPANNSVTINGTQAQVMNASPTQLEVVIPIDAMSGVITVSTDGGIDTSTADFIVLDPTIVQRFPADDRQFNSIAYSGSELVAVGNAVGGVYAIVAKSTDGLMWTLDSLSAIDTVWSLNSVIWDGSQFVALSNDGYVFTSPDGTQWTTISQAVGWSEGEGLYFDGFHYFVFGSLKIAKSSDLINWSTIDVPFMVMSMFKSHNLYVAVGGGIWSSPDASVWTKRDSVEGLYKDVIWSGSKFVAVQGGSLVISDDGISWSQKLGNFVGLFSTVTAGGYYFASGECNDQLVISNDGLTWESSRLCVGNAEMVDFIWTGERFVFVSPGGSVYTLDWP